MAILLAFIVVPIAEIALLIHVGGLIGAWETVALVVLTAVIGTALFRAQGLRVLLRAQDVMAQGGFPAKELFDGICILVAGVLLLTPGFITDTLGLALLMPGLRVWIGRLLWQAARRSGHVHMHMEGASWHDSGRPTPDDVIEGDFTVVGPDESAPRRERIDKPGGDQKRQ
ncbi:MAG: FxsA family protein [Alphaproteobacteria bacterium]|nr:FxsA family protein [Alphaproteobacteria bacterium]